MRGRKKEKKRRGENSNLSFFFSQKFRGEGGGGGGGGAGGATSGQKKPFPLVKPGRQRKEKKKGEKREQRFCSGKVASFFRISSCLFWDLSLGKKKKEGSPPTESSA